MYVYFLVSLLSVMYLLLSRKKLFSVIEPIFVSIWDKNIKITATKIGNN